MKSSKSPYDASKGGFKELHRIAKLKPKSLSKPSPYDASKSPLNNKSK